MCSSTFRDCPISRGDKNKFLPFIEISMIIKGKGSTIEKDVWSIWALSVCGGGGVLDTCQDGLGHLFREV